MQLSSLRGSPGGTDISLLGPQGSFKSLLLNQALYEEKKAGQIPPQRSAKANHINERGHSWSPIAKFSIYIDEAVGSDGNHSQLFPPGGMEGERHQDPVFFMKKQH